MFQDERCCGSGTCIIDASGRCWCGQQWNGHTMCHPTTPTTAGKPPAEASVDPARAANTPSARTAPRTPPA